MTPHRHGRDRLKAKSKTIALEQLVGEVFGNLILPYPTGVPLLM
ncbi:hypothetical protein ACNKHM_06515 [Shigella sonnei]